MYNSVTDFASFADDMFIVAERAQRQDVSADPNQTVQSFIDLCARHEHNFYKFVHEVHIHDNGLFTQLMGWLEGILEFLRHGPKGGKLDINALFQGGVDMGLINKDTAILEINSLIKWQEERKKWHQDKTRQKMAADHANGVEVAPGAMTFKSSDFGLNEVRALLHSLASISSTFLVVQLATRFYLNFPSPRFNLPPLANAWTILTNPRPTSMTWATIPQAPRTKSPPMRTWSPSLRSASAALRSRTIFAARRVSLLSLRFRRSGS